MKQINVVDMARQILDMNDEIQYLRLQNGIMKEQLDRYRGDLENSIREYETHFAGILDKLVTKATKE